MLEAYEVGISLALQDGVSAGIALIRRDLDALDRAIAATSQNLARLHSQAGTAVTAIAPNAPAPATKPPLTDPSATLTQRPLVQPVLDNPNTHQARLNTDPPAAPLPATDRRSVSAPQPAPSPPPAPIAIPPAPVSSNPAPAPSATSPIASPPSSAPARPNPIAPSAPVATPAFASVSSIQHIAAPTIRPASPPASPRPNHVTQPSVFSPALVTPRQSNVAHTGNYSSPAAYAGAGHGTLQSLASPLHTARPSTPAAPGISARTAFAAAPASLTARPLAARAETTPSAPATSAVPPAAASPTITLQGDIILDGTRLGRWMTSSLARQAARPPSGPTGPDPRQTPLWSGQAQGF